MGAFLKATAASAMVLGLLPGRALANPPPETQDIPVVLLTDLGSGRELFARGPNLRFVPASMAKVMTLQVAFREIANGRLSRNKVFRVDPALAREWNGKGTSLYLRPGEQVTLNVLLHAIATVSANDAAMVLATGHAGSLSSWTAMMNAEAKRLGMKHSRFATPTGWPDNGATFVSARDLVILANAVISDHPAYYRLYIGKQGFTFRGVRQTSHNPVIGLVAGADGIKTGHTREAGYNFLGSAKRNGIRLVMVVAGAKNESQRTSASRSLLEWGFSEWERRPLFTIGKVVGKVRVQGGDARHVSLVSPIPLHATYPRGTTPSIRLSIRYRGPLVAPVARGARVAWLDISTGDGGHGSVPLFAADTVGKAGPLDRLRNGLYGLLP